MEGLFVRGSGVVIHGRVFVLSLGYSVYISFTNWNMTRPVKKFVGVDNYTRLLSNSDFYHSLKVTFLYTVMDVVFTLVIGLLLALLLNVSSSRLFGFMRGVIFMPYYISMVVAAMVFTWIYNGQYGLLNSIVSWFGMEPVEWLTNPSTALPALVAVSVWKGVGFAMILFIAGMRGIPAEYYEAASIDGASKLRQFRNITLPLLSPMTLFLVITSFISSMQVFQSIDVMTGGGPLTSSYRPSRCSTPCTAIGYRQSCSRIADLRGPTWRQICTSRPKAFTAPHPGILDVYLLFLLFGVMLIRTGIGSFFNDLAFALTGRFTGGQGKAAVVASAMQGMVSGGSVANTVGSGSFTIPMMKRPDTARVCRRR